jgi:hypothetical protein
MRRIAMAVVLGALVVWPATLPADDTTSGAVIQSTEVFHSPRGVHILYAARSADNAPVTPLLNRLVLEFPPGVRLNKERFPSCDVAELQANGPAGCRPRARVGSGSVRGYLSSLFPPEIGGTLTIFNGPTSRDPYRRLLLIHVRPKLGPAFVMVGKWNGNRREGMRVDFGFPITIPEIEQPSLNRFLFRFSARRGRHLFLRVPCPATFKTTAYYATGAVVTSSDRARCG